MFFFKKIVIFNFFVIFFYVFLFSTSYSLDTKSYSYGLSVYKRGNCMGCHSWHGKGGHGAGVSLRMSKLNFDELVEIIKCGRPGSGMPYFYKKSYLKERCYDTLITDYTDDNFKPISSKKFLNN